MHFYSNHLFNQVSLLFRICVLTTLSWLSILSFWCDSLVVVCAVTAIVPGYKSKTTVISLEESGTNVDFIFDPEVDRRWDSMSIIWGPRLEVYLLMIVVAVFLLFLCRRRTISRLKQRQLAGLKRPVVVWDYRLFFCRIFYLTFICRNVNCISTKLSRVFSLLDQNYRFSLPLFISRTYWFFPQVV